MEQDYFKANQALWNARTPHHIASKFYNMEGFLAGETSLKKIELEELSSLDLKGKKVLHLMCHFGQDSLSLARMGAEVTGIDFSNEAIKKAREINEQLDLSVRFIECNIYDLPQYLDEKFDLVFTSYGVLGWLPDMGRWAKIVAHFLKPQGIFYIAEFHPTFYLFDFDKKTIAYPYFNHGNPIAEEADSSYTDGSDGFHGTEYFWQHSMEEILQPLLYSGLNLLTIKEFDYAPYNCFPNMKKRNEQEFVFSIDGHSLPHIFSLTMQKR